MSILPANNDGEVHIGLNLRQEEKPDFSMMGNKVNQDVTPSNVGDTAHQILPTQLERYRMNGLGFLTS